VRDERAYLLHAVEAIDAILNYTVDGREAFEAEPTLGGRHKL